MYSKTVTVANYVGLHSRPATFLVNKATDFKSSVWIEKGSRRVNAKSLLGVLSLGVSKDEEITLIAEGDDEQSAVEALIALIESDFAE